VERRDDAKLCGRQAPLSLVSRSVAFCPDAFLAVSNGTRVPAPCALRLRPGKVVACAQGMCDEDQPPCPRYVNGMPREQHTSCVSYLVK